MRFLIPTLALVSVLLPLSSASADSGVPITECTWWHIHYGPYGPEVTCREWRVLVPSHEHTGPRHRYERYEGADRHHRHQRHFRY